jgi:hypothetical protein
LSVGKAARRWWWGVGVAAAVLVAVVAAVVWWPDGTPTAPAAVPSGPAVPSGAVGPAVGIIGGLCMQVIGNDVRVFTDPRGDQTWTTWLRGTQFWVDPDEGTGHRYRTTLRDGRHGWIGVDPKYVTSAQGCS